MSLTRGQIISEALSQAGRTDLTSNARLWLNLFLEKIYKTQDWDWLVKDSGVLALVQNGPVPTDYWKMKSATLIRNGIPQLEIETVLSDEWASLQRGASSANGGPYKAWVNEDLRTFSYWPTPDNSFSWQFWYYYMPVLPTHTTSAGDSATPKWELNDEILIRAVQMKALYYNDDKRYNEGVQELMQEILSAKMNSAEFRAGRSKIRLGKSFRRRF